MPIPTPQSTAKKTRVFTFPTGAALYDTLMRGIEPELVTANLKKLDAPYTHESDADRKRRYKRYGKAFTAYQKAFKAWSAVVRRAIAQYKKALSRAGEATNKRQEDTFLQSLEFQILSA